MHKGLLYPRIQVQERTQSGNEIGISVFVEQSRDLSQRNAKRDLKGPNLAPFFALFSCYRFVRKQ